jgi:hypothetical protein
MTALLMHAVRWEQMVPGDMVPLSPKALMRQRKLRMREHDTTPESNLLRWQHPSTHPSERASSVLENHSIVVKCRTNQLLYLAIQHTYCISSCSHRHAVYPKDAVSEGAVIEQQPRSETPVR